MSKTVSFLASGRGSNFTAVAKEIKAGKFKAKLGVLIADKESAMALQIANDFGMDSFFVDPGKYNTREDHENEMVKIFKKYKTDCIVAAGYMRILTPFFINTFRNRIINIHPALLPSFPGINGQKQAFDYGVKITGCTTHFVDEGTDTGPIIMQAPVEINQDESLQTLSSKILKEEHRILPQSVKLFCENRLQVMGRKVIIK